MSVYSHFLFISEFWIFVALGFILISHSNLACQRKTSFAQEIQNDEQINKLENNTKPFNFTEYVKNFQRECECGKRREKSGRISGGADAEKNEFPSQAALVYRNTRIPFCGGTLLNNLFILTAAHCVLNLPSLTLTNVFKPNAKPEDFIIDNDFQVLLNAHKLTPLDQITTSKLYNKFSRNSWAMDSADAERDFEEGTLRFDVRRKIYHPQFISEYAKNGFDYDIALLELSAPVDLAHRNAPIPACLPEIPPNLTSREDAETTEDYENEKLTTIGWGRTIFKNPNSGSPILQKLEMPAYSLESCIQISGLFISKRFICAGYKTKQFDIGKSDSGGPLLVQRRNRTIVVGLVSWGSGEKEGRVVSVFTKIMEFLPWIFEHLNNSNNSNGVRWCSEPNLEDEISSNFADENSKLEENSSKFNDTDFQSSNSSFITSQNSSDTNENESYEDNAIKMIQLLDAILHLNFSSVDEEPPTFQNMTNATKVF